MKILKVRIRRGAVGQPMMLYPAGYNAQQVDREGIYALGLPVQDALSGGIGLGDPEEWCLISLNNDVADQYALDPDMEVVTEAEANALLTDWRAVRLSRGAPGERGERITDQGALDLIKAKRDANPGYIPSAKERDAMDPGHGELGISRLPRTVPQRALGAG